MFISHKSNVIQHIHETEWGCRRKSKGISNQNIEYGMENLKLYFNDAELASALIYAKKKKLLNFI